MRQSFIPRLLGCVPVSLRRAIIGQPTRPSRVATYLHKLVNRVPHGESEVLVCHGALEGYRMAIDWDHFRSFAYGTWEPNVLQAVTSAVKPGMKVIDIGAHIGYYTLLFAKCVGPSGRVASFEPSPANFAALQKNVQLNHLENVQTFSEAMFSETKEITLNIPRGLTNSGDASINRMDGAMQLRVRAITLDSFCASVGFCPDFLKLDVEGAEHEVLMGGRETIAHFRPRMLVELHHFDGNLAAHPVPDLLTEWGYEFEWLDRWDMTSHILAVPKSLGFGGPAHGA
jgi:FkbM family methyltransferase